MKDERIKEIMLAAGFEIKTGLTDLKTYCYTAARAIESEVRKEQADKIATLERQLAEARKDSERIDAIEFFTREPDEWESKYGRCSNGDTWCWTFYAPKGVQGDTRRIVDAAIKEKEQSNG